MGTKWILEVEPDANKEDAYVIRLGVKRAEANQFADLIRPCRSLQEFQEEMEKLLRELNELPAKARERIESLNFEGATGSKMVPEKVWKEMAAFATEAEMVQFFNSFAEPQRQQIAEYIFSHVNMFKGRGPVFSEHYDSVTHLLD